MFRVTQHTRRGGEVPCELCEGHVRPGDAYRLRVILREDWANGFPVVSYAHESCAGAPAPYWRLTETPEARTEQRGRDEDSLDYVRDYYGLTLYVGQVVLALGRRGQVVRGTNHVYVRFSDEARVHNYHPHDIQVVSPPTARL